MPEISSAKERVLLIASDLFMEFGFKAVSMRQIAQKLEVEPSAIYYHFPQGKSALFDAVIDYNMSHQKENLTQVISEANGEISEKLDAVANWFVNQHSIDMMRILRMDVQQMSEDYEDQIVEKITESLMQPIINVFETAINKQQIRSIDPLVLAGTFIASMNWIGFVVTARRMNKSKTDLIEETVSIFLHGILIKEY
ncbi:MAG: TetR/AcrR family transcriptional regulator [Chloroflexota bacterium]